MDTLKGVFFAVWVPFFCTAVSAIYLLTSPKTQPLWKRILSSAHGASIAAIYAIGFLVLANQSTKYAAFFLTSLLAPIGLIIASFFTYKGLPRWHLLQIANVSGIIFTFFWGSMFFSGAPM